ncbi:MAG: sulfurtransferase [bacterium]|nr:sulfurtransferase [bacterium]
MNPLIEIDEFVKIIDRPDVKVFDLRGDWGTPPASKKANYLEAHIPGAVFIDWIKDFLEKAETVALAPVAGYEKTKASARRLGINNDDTVILYDDYNNMFAARTWWALRYWGHPRVRILNGGWTQWQASGRAVAKGEELPAVGDFEPSEKPQHIINTDAVRDAAIGAGDQPYIIDARGPVGYEKGHIASAINLPYSDVVDKETALFKADAEIAQVFDEKIPEWKSKPIIASCGAGYAATIVLAALEKLGVQSPLYDGSYSVYSRRA